METIFWFFFGILLYTYFGYPVLLFIIHTVASYKDRYATVKDRDKLSNVSVIVAAYNEQDSISTKIENTLRLNYPNGIVEMIVVSDCSNDMTDEIVKRYADKNVKLARLSIRSGKTAAQNVGARISTGEILVFSDATTIFDKGALTYLLRHFEDERVGCVGGRLVFVSPKKETAKLYDKNLYEKLEEHIRTYESDIKTTFGIDGCIYAVRKNLYRPLDETLTSDFVIPLTLIKEGLKVVYEKKALAFEELPIKYGYELKRKIRTVRVGITGLYFMRSLLNPIRFGIWIPFSLISHKILRWCSPFALSGLLFSNAFLIGNTFYRNIFLLQIAFYLFAFFGYTLARGRLPKFVSIPLYFCILNIAALFGFFEFLKGKRTEVWETARP